MSGAKTGQGTGQGSGQERGPNIGPWLGRLEAELARELGQPVTLAAGGEPPIANLWTALELPGARLTLAADAEGLAGVLVEGKLIASGQGDRETVRELWEGILTSVAARLEGRALPEEHAGAGEIAPCTLRLGGASAHLALAVDRAAATVTGAAGLAAAAEAPLPAAARAVAAHGPYDLLLEVELDAQVRFGSRELELKDLLELGPGDVVELDRNVGDPVDLIVGGRIVARGEVVLVDGSFGLRVTEVVEPVRRLESIRCMG